MTRKKSLFICNHDLVAIHGLHLLKSEDSEDLFSLFTIFGICWILDFAVISAQTGQSFNDEVMFSKDGTLVDLPTP